MISLCIEAVESPLVLKELIQDLPDAKYWNAKSTKRATDQSQCCPEKQICRFGGLMEQPTSIMKINGYPRR